MYIEEISVKMGKGLKTYKLEDAIEASRKYFKGDELAATVWVNKYALKDSHGNLYELTPDDMHRRLAREIARIEKRYPNPMTEDQIFELLKDFTYIIPQGGPMSGIGNPFQVSSLSNCFVIGNDGSSDSYGGILKIDQEQVQLMKRRGGVGHDLSHIRPTSSPVMNSALTSTGVVPFMERYSNSTREVAQDGRRGALMLSISIKHPDSENFIDAKTEKGKVTGANVSVKITDEFMQAVITGEPFTQQFPIDSDKPTHVKEIDARKLWSKVIHNAWKSAEPGVLFWDTVIRESVPDSYADLGFRTVSTNPCGEIPLCPYDSCRLLAINLYSYVDQPFTEEARFDFDKFREHVHYAQRIMDDIVDLESEKIDGILAKVNADPEDFELKRVELKLWENIKRKTEQGRRTGIGITAEGDMLAALNLGFGSDNAIDFAVEVQKVLAIEAYRSSVNLARDRGAFSMYNAQREKDNPFIQRIREADPKLYEEMVVTGRRNLALLTIAPTGTTSLMSQTTSGIEPVFRPVYRRRRKVNPSDPETKVSFVDEIGDSWEEFNVFHHKFMDWLKIKGYDTEAVKSYSEEQIEELVKVSPYYKSTSNDIDWVAKVRMQGEIQKWVDHSISVTVNLPADIPESTVAEVYRTAWESGCKGITVYREGSREGVLLKAAEKNKNEDTTPSHSHSAHKRPPILEAELLRFKNSQEDWIAFVGMLDGHPYEIFTGRAEDDTLVIPKSITHGRIIKVKTEGGARYDFQYTDKYGNPCTVGGLSYMFDKEFWNYAKLISGVLRHGMPIPYVVNLVESLRLDSENINSWKTGVARALKQFIKDGTRAPQGERCENCNSESLVYQEGCLICLECGHSKCG
ncbi:MAG: adenosylcobalamin-dependent ribonucleoside-diphosphate reductase [Bacteroidales bacterium]|nr:adenosylcobalamin-dependent ribonucleoside-diphosphate reductase [Bacteroidales bacterium]MDD3385666.1 adenosylcobalamin-dependent ribonucleoside-diphosphate reductase [Bacteroidales bacterium]MDD3812228.1 adenosylcobalamin-dependent ribonucleoside-diphosphate reductase [Bacteroidales bacterium]MDD3871007.1 adenosylcobalamin-dependent ribonucleoside-diphosphate reductase [Bacteroidales bacterium]MDD4813632.1 adenosylcobalamin-dependent ribonucleoside-diphosphate reductase [Bacteroidales bact